MTVVETTAGPVRGVTNRGIEVFRGVPYATARRFRPPTGSAPWSEVRDADRFGPMAPQPLPELTPQMEAMRNAGDPWHHEMAEDCLVANVWTASADDRRRPVLVWCHGGAFTAGLGDAPWQDGTNLALEDDVVVVTFNHRLGVFGFLGLGGLGDPEFADSGNLGMLDIVALLRWVRDNIARFGGDPDNVTVFGESGGGWKINVLLAMPVAQGLFHKAIVQSGSFLQTLTAERADAHARRILAELDVAPDRLDLLDGLPMARILEAARCVQNTDRQRRRFGTDGEILWDVDFAPVLDGRTLARQPYDPDGPDIAAGVPLIVGSTADDGTPVPRPMPTDEQAMRDEVRALGLSAEEADELLAAYPGSSLEDRYLGVLTDIQFRVPAILQAERHDAHATVYMYEFAWDWHLAGGRSPHAVDVPFVFDALDDSLLGDALLGDDHVESTRGVARAMRAAWAAFARTGDPNHPGLPRWDPYDLAARATMVFDHERASVADPRPSGRIAVQERLAARRPEGIPAGSSRGT